MLCERCGINKAEVHLVKIVNGERSDEHICRECAVDMLPFEEAAKMMKMTFSLEGIMDVQDALRDLIMPIMPELSAEDDGMISCPHCGGPLHKDLLFEPIKAAPDKEADEVSPEIGGDELAILKREMELAVKEERYEHAADIRDRIRYLEKSGGEEKGA